MNKKLIPALLVLFSIFTGCGNSASGDKDTQESNTISTSTDSIVTLTDTTYNYANLKFSCTSILKSEYDLQRANYYINDTLEKITDFEKVKTLLNGIAYWTDTIAGTGTSLLEELRFRNGETLRLLEPGDEYPEEIYVGDYWFVAYYPTEDVLMLEGGHSSDMSYNLTTGEDILITGDPSISQLSHDKKYRIMAYYTGQMSVYFLQKKGGKTYKNLFPLQDNLLSSYDMEYIIESFWDNSHNFYFIAPSYPEGEEIRKYYKLSISPYKRATIPNKDFIIKENQAGNFTIGMNIDDIKTKYTLMPEITYKEENTIQESFYIFRLGIRLFTPQSDRNYSQENQNVNEILVCNSKYSTDKLIGTGSTIGEFRQAYPDAGIFYSYISDTFWLETSQLKNIQFRLEKDDFEGNHKSLMEGESVELPFSSFKADTEISEIRIF